MHRPSMRFVVAIVSYGSVNKSTAAGIRPLRSIRRASRFAAKERIGRCHGRNTVLENIINSTAARRTLPPRTSRYRAMAANCLCVGQIEISLSNGSSLAAEMLGVPNPTDYLIGSRCRRPCSNNRSALPARVSTQQTFARRQFKVRHEQGEIDSISILLTIPKWRLRNLRCIVFGWQHRKTLYADATGWATVIKEFMANWHSAQTITAMACIVRSCRLRHNRVRFDFDERFAVDQPRPLRRSSSPGGCL